MKTEEIAETSTRTRRSRNHECSDVIKNGMEKPNELSEELMKCLIGIFFKLNQASPGSKGSTSASRHHISCINSKGFMSRTSFNCKAPEFSFDKTSNIDPYGILPDFDGLIRDVGPYKNFFQITRSSLNISQISECIKAMGKLRYFHGTPTDLVAIIFRISLKYKGHPYSFLPGF